MGIFNDDNYIIRCDDCNGALWLREAGLYALRQAASQVVRAKWLSNKPGWIAILQKSQKSVQLLNVTSREVRDL